MDVQCERCKTEYEFDDALVSGRGTTVRCTHCGHQFKVRRSEAEDSAGDRWVVRTAAGQVLTFLTLRELQRAILAKEVARVDSLLQAGAAPRELGSIAELEPFFDGRASTRPPHRVASQPPGPSDVRASFVPPPPGAVTPPTGFEVYDTSSSFPPPTAPVRRSLPSGDDEASGQQPASPASTDEAYDVPRRRRVGGWVVSFVLLLAVGVVGLVVAKRYLVARPPSVSEALDARAIAFLEAAEKDMADGDLDAAQQHFDKASVLAEHDPRVLLGVARVAAAKADVPWLKLKLLPVEATEQVRTTRALLEESAARARKAADDAVAAAPDDSLAMRAKIDALRLTGERESARGYVSRVSALASQPETAYVLAALDMAEPQPLWPTVVDRLRLAAGAERSAGRARAALVYALAVSGDGAGAATELSKLDALARPYALLPELHALLERSPGKATPDTLHAMAASSAASSAASTAAALRVAAPAPPAQRAPAPGGASPGGGGAIAGEQAGAMQAASQAFKKADFARARRIYEALIARNPNDSEALSGIGDVDRAEGDSAAAIAAYKRALAVNPSYLPALLGVADTEWARGDQAHARTAYREISDHFPEGTYPAYVKDRSEAPAPPAVPRPAPTAAASSPDPGDGI